MNCVVSQLLMRVAVALILPVSQEFLVTRETLIGDRQSAKVNDCDRAMREHGSGCSTGLCGAERKTCSIRT